MDPNQFSGSAYDNIQHKQHNPASINERYIASYMSKVYGWMFLGLSLTAVVAMLVASSEAAINLFYGTPLFIVLILAQLFLVGFLAIRVQHMSSSTATAIFIGYAILTGITFSALLLRYTTGSLVTVFGITAGTFGIMSAVGYFTKQDLTSFGRIMLMGLIGIVLASLVNFFLRSESLYWIISYVGVAVFVGLIAYDTQKIKAYALLANEEDRKKGAILGALALYLDFVNLFIFLLRLFGGRRN
ncbi:Bax inhibitor-1/YccA family protein [Taibaiella koreensis]|uniref:Bax inhibitor-1/YccA family protein n=1 Tax=Taibaiella koreensis TaxID=1268548 RepID=UPI000E59AF02|nr:Bax inhibitor-1/YccA family protein [Taibaiella koreensis]